MHCVASRLMEYKLFSVIISFSILPLLDSSCFTWGSLTCSFALKSPTSITSLFILFCFVWMSSALYICLIFSIFSFTWRPYTTPMDMFWGFHSTWIYLDSRYSCSSTLLSSTIFSAKFSVIRIPISPLLHMCRDLQSICIIWCWCFHILAVSIVSVKSAVSFLQLLALTLCFLFFFWFFLRSWWLLLGI